MKSSIIKPVTPDIEPIPINTHTSLSRRFGLLSFIKSRKRFIKPSIPRLLIMLMNVMTKTATDRENNATICKIMEQICNELNLAQI